MRDDDNGEERSLLEEQKEGKKKKAYSSCVCVFAVTDDVLIQPLFALISCL